MKIRIAALVWLFQINVGKNKMSHSFKTITLEHEEKHISLL